MLEIERKFLIQKLPDLSQIKPIRYERYFISDEDKNQIRVQKKGHKYELETKQQINEQEYYKTKREITKTEFLELSAECNKSIIRLSYLISQSPNITIKKYCGPYEGLVRAEIEYDSIEQIGLYELPKWFGKEITGTVLANDHRLIKLNRTEFLECLKSLRQLT